MAKNVTLFEGEEDIADAYGTNKPVSENFHSPEDLQFYDAAALPKWAAHLLVLGGWSW